MLAAPLILMFFTLLGVKVLMGIPVEPKANWIFRLLEPADRVAAVAGVRNALVAMLVAPIATVAGASAAALWGGPTGLAHGVVCAAMGWLLIELALVRLRKVPFTCTYVPARTRMAGDRRSSSADVRR